MIQSFKESNTYGLFIDRKSKRWANIAKVALGKLDQVEAAVQLTDLRIPPGNQLEALCR